MKKNAISPTREENYSEWYLSVIKNADLAEHSPTRGCMIIKPWGYSIWENMKDILDEMIKETGHQNVYFPLLIPISFFEKEAKHVEGFAKECAVVTHCKLEKKDNKLVPSSPLEEPFIIRPTSEMIIGEAFSRWIQSYRDLPILINQWANIIRWEMRPRMFLRTTEFLWQEGHTIHQFEDQAKEEVKKMLDLYANFSNQYLAIPVIKGEKTESEKFPGAVNTYCIEAMMQDKKALQAGTSHFLGQNFSKASNIKYNDENGKINYPYSTSWGVTTRLIGGLIMVHSDDDGLVLPPRISPYHVIIQPVFERVEIMEFCEKLKDKLKSIRYNGTFLKVKIDDRDIRGGEKKWEWIKKGVPIRVEIGEKEVKDKNITFFKRNNHNERIVEKEKSFVENLAKILEDIQNDLLKKANDFLNKNIKIIFSEKEFYDFFKTDQGFALCHFSLNREIEEKIKKELNVTVRAIPLEIPKEEGKCIFTGKRCSEKVIFAKAY